MTGDREGPSEVVIPEQRYMSCCGCKWFTKSMIRSGRDPVYDTICNHPVWSKEYDTKWSTGRQIGGLAIDAGKAPSWCPVINKPTEQ